MNALSSAIARTTRQNRAASELEPAQRFARALEANAAAEVTVKFARESLKAMAIELFTVPVTVADAAEALQLDLSVKHIDKEDTKQRAWVQRIRVNLQRALKDAGMLVTKEGAGRPKAEQAEGGSESGEGSDDAGPSISGLLATVLAALPRLSNAELDAVTDALLAMNGMAD